MNQIDIGISVNFPYILNNNFINLFKYGILNAHGGDLPRYRGTACQAWAIINGEKRIGLCVHKMEPDELDNGDIISKEYLNINSNTKILEIYKWIEQKTPILFLDSIRKLQENSSYILQKQSKNPKDILMCYPRKPDDGKINWLMKSIDIHRLVNASRKPYQGAFCYCENKKYFINDTNIIKYKHRILALPGQILKISDDFLDVATGDGVIRIKEINYKNKIVNIKKIFKSIRLRLS